MMYNKQNWTNVNKDTYNSHLQNIMPIRKANLGLDSVNYKINCIVCPKHL